MKSVSIAIKELDAAIVRAINDSQLPPCIVELVVGRRYNQIAQQAQNEFLQAQEQRENNEEVSG